MLWRKWIKLSCRTNRCLKNPWKRWGRMKEGFASQQVEELQGKSWKKSDRSEICWTGRRSNRLLEDNPTSTALPNRSRIKLKPDSDRSSISLTGQRSNRMLEQNSTSPALSNQSRIKQKPNKSWTGLRTSRRFNDVQPVQHRSSTGRGTNRDQPP